MFLVVLSNSFSTTWSSYNPVFIQASSLLHTSKIRPGLAPMKIPVGFALKTPWKPSGSIKHTLILNTSGFLYHHCMSQCQCIVHFPASILKIIFNCCRGSYYILKSGHGLVLLLQMVQRRTRHRTAM